MAGFTRSTVKSGLLGLSLFGTCLTHAALPNGNPFAETHTDYMRWVVPADRALGDAAHPLKLLITTPTKDSVTGMWVAMDGGLSNFYRSDWGGRGGGGASLSPEDLKKLDDMLARLPNGKQSRPPEGRPLVFQFSSSGHPVTRIYDRADAPVLIWDVVRLCHCDIERYFPEIQPQTVIQSPVNEGVFFCLNPEGDELILGAHNSIQMWDFTSHEYLRSIGTNLDGRSGMAFSPDGKTAVLSTAEDTFCFDSGTWKEIARLKAVNELCNVNRFPMRHPQFTHDGHYLVLWADGLNQVQIYDTGTWQKVPGLPEVPAGAERYTLSSNGERAIVQSAKSSVELWDVGKHEKIAALGENAHESAVSFSPDGSMVTMVQINGPDKDIRLKVWSTQTGNVLQKFSSYEVPNLGAVSAIGWSNDGEYLFIAPNSDSSWVSFNIRVLNVKTGLHLGDFADSEGTVGIVYLPKIGQLIAGGGDGRVRFWDFNSALQQIKAFKASLEN